MIVSPNPAGTSQIKFRYDTETLYTNDISVGRLVHIGRGRSVFHRVWIFLLLSGNYDIVASIAV